MVVTAVVAGVVGLGVIVGAVVVIDVNAGGVATAGSNVDAGAVVLPGPALEGGAVRSTHCPLAHTPRVEVCGHIHA